MTGAPTPSTETAALVDLFGLAGKVVVVTGANRGIGRGIALAMASLGATVVAAARNAEAGARLVDEINSSGGRASFMVLELQDEQSVVDAFAALHGQLGAIDILVNNAGIFPATPLLEATGDEWDEMFRINTRGPFLCLREVARTMIAADRQGRIINISSMGSLLPAAPSRIAYNASKAALNRLTQDAAAGLARHGILVNAVLPGPTDTSGSIPRDEQSAKLHAVVAGRIPLRRWAARWTWPAPLPFWRVRPRHSLRARPCSWMGDLRWATANNSSWHTATIESVRFETNQRAVQIGCRNRE